MEWKQTCGAERSIAIGGASSFFCFGLLEVRHTMMLFPLVAKFPAGRRLADQLGSLMHGSFDNLAKPTNQFKSPRLQPLGGVALYLPVYAVLCRVVLASALTGQASWLNLLDIGWVSFLLAGPFYELEVSVREVRTQTRQPTCAASGQLTAGASPE